MAQAVHHALKIGWLPVLTGVLAFLAAHALVAVLQPEPVSASPPGVDTTWFLNSPGGVALVCTGMALAALVLGLFSRRHFLVNAAFLTIGAVVALVWQLVARGGSSLFPIVIMVGGGLIFAATAVGALLAMSLRRLHIRH